MGGEKKQNWLIAVPEIIMADSAFIYLINLMIVVTRFVRDSLVKYLLLVVVSEKIKEIIAYTPFLVNFVTNLNI